MVHRPPRRYAGERPLDGDETRRRGLAVRIATDAHASAQDAMAFLNTPHPTLGGRPLDIATGSEAGLAAVTATLKG